MRAVLVGAGSGLLVGVVALVAVVGLGWPVDHRALTTEKDGRPVALPATFAGMTSQTGQQDVSGLGDDVLRGRPAATSMYGAAGSGAVGVMVARGWTTGDSDMVSGPETVHGEVRCLAPATLTFPGEPGSSPLPMYCERLGDTLSVSALVVLAGSAAPSSTEQLAAEVDALWLAHR